MDKVTTLQRFHHFYTVLSCSFISFQLHVLLPCKNHKRHSLARYWNSLIITLLSRLRPLGARGRVYCWIQQRAKKSSKHTESSQLKNIMTEISEYERQRQLNIQENRKVLESLGLLKPVSCLVLSLVLCAMSTVLFRPFLRKICSSFECLVTNNVLTMYVVERASVIYVFIQTIFFSSVQ